MALINVVKYDASDSDFVYKYPSNDLRIGTQVVVGISQTAFFVKGGQIFDQFASGTHTISTDNIPVLNKLMNLPFGGETPFQAEVWYVNLISKLDLKWGTANPIQIEDPKYSIIIPIRAYGQYGFKISNPRKFLETLVGNMSSFTPEKINEYFKGKLLSQLTSILSSRVVNDGISVLEIPTQLIDLSQRAKEVIKLAFQEYGIHVENFDIISVNYPEDDPSIKKLKEVKDLAVKLKILGKDMYQVERSFDVLEKAAENEGGSASSIINSGLGLGVGLKLSDQISNAITPSNRDTSIPPIPTTYYFLVKGQQVGPFILDQAKSMFLSGQISLDTLAWTNGMIDWKKVQEIESLRMNFVSIPPSPPQTF
jgi:membrane protease subunit (stomatin/prohibitin family)